MCDFSYSSIFCTCRKVFYLAQYNNEHYLFKNYLNLLVIFSPFFQNKMQNYFRSFGKTCISEEDPLLQTLLQFEAHIPLHNHNSGTTEVSLGSSNNVPADSLHLSVGC